MARKGKRKQMHVVAPPRDDKMTIRIGKEELQKMDRAARRQAEIDAGMLIPGGVRGGVHGGGKHEHNKRGRRDNKRECSDAEKGGYKDKD